MPPVDVDLTGGLAPSAEHGLREHPKLDFMRDSVSVWIYDDEGRFGLPRVTMEARGPTWDPKLLQVNVAFAGGRVLNGSGPVPARSVDDPSVYAGGPLEFRCVEPFEQWSVTYDGTALDTTSQATAAGGASGERVPLKFELDVRMAAPPWISGEMSTEADELLEESDGIFVGGRKSFEDGMRYEQLVTSQGTLQVGDEEWSFSGSGIRVRRQGLRNLEGFAGHVWQSALFPSGRGFGYMWLLPNNYKEGYVYDGGRMLPARIVETSWLTRFVPEAGEDVSFVLETEHGRTEIKAETVYSVFIPEGEEFPTEGKWPLHWQQSGVKYTWDGEEAYGMMERSSSPDKVTR